MDLVYQAPFANMKMERERRPEMSVILGRPGIQYVAMVTKLLSSNCGAHLVESHCKESCLTKIRCHHFANLHILKLEYLWNKKRYLKIVNSIFLLMQATCLCFKMASIE